MSKAKSVVEKLGMSLYRYLQERIRRPDKDRAGSVADFIALLAQEVDYLRARVEELEAEKAAKEVEMT